MPTAGPEEAIPALTERVRALGPDLVVTAGTMAEAVDESTIWSKVIGVGTIVAGLGGLLLALVGLFGTVSYEAQSRMREVAIRRALGASDHAARRLLLMSSLRVTAVGIGLGLVGAIVVGGLVGALLHGVPSHDPLALGGVAAALLLAVVTAGLHPAGRALRVPPAVLLKED